MGRGFIKGYCLNLHKFTSILKVALISRPKVMRLKKTRYLI